MAQAKREGLRRGLLFGYMLICIVLIGLVLASGLYSDQGEEQPEFYRATMGSRDAIYQAQTEAAEYFQATPTHEPGGQQNQGRGGSGGN